MERSFKEGGELLPLRRMASRLGVPSRWLREQAESGAVPCLKAGNRFLFAPQLVREIVTKMAQQRGAEKSLPKGGAS